MPNGKEMLRDLEFEDKIKDFSRPEQFLARQIREVKRECETRKTCYPPVQLSRKQMAMGAGSLTGLIAVVSGIIEAIKIATRGG